MEPAERNFFMGEFMARKMKLLLIVLLFLCIAFNGVTYTYSAINEKIYVTIRVAYMNGFIDAMAQDIKKIEQIKENRAILKEEVQQASERYEKYVREMNEMQ